MRAGRLAAPALLVAAALAAGCLGRSSAARSYVLDPVAAAPAATDATPAPLAVVGIDRVRVPDWLDRPQVASRAASGQVVADEFSRWGEPLPLGLQRVVAENLALLLPDRRVVSAPFSPRDRVDHFLEIVVLDATRQVDGSVVLDCRFTVLASDGRVLARQRTSHTASAGGPGARGAVAGLNDALAGLSRELADVLGQQSPTAAPESKGP